MRGKPLRNGNDASQSCPNEEDDRNQEILPCLIQGAPLPCPEIDAECFHPAADVPDTHRTRVCITVNISKCLNLHCARERGQNIGDWVKKIADRKEPDDRQQTDFGCENDMAPVEGSVGTAMGVDLVRDDNAESERNNRKKVADRAAEIPCEKMVPHENEIPGQRVRENFSSHEI